MWSCCVCEMKHDKEIISFKSCLYVSLETEDIGNRGLYLENLLKMHWKKSIDNEIGSL